MTRLTVALEAITKALDECGARWALIGGFAVAARAEPRTTRDIDIAVAVTGDADAEKLVSDLRASGYHAATQIEQTATGRLATVRLTQKRLHLFIDLLFASSGIEPELVAAADRIRLGRRLILPVAQRGHLIALKLLARNDDTRPQDLIDLHPARLPSWAQPRRGTGRAHRPSPRQKPAPTLRVARMYRRP